MHTLPEEWAPQIPDLEARLEAGARVADICCGHGWALVVDMASDADLRTPGDEIHRALYGFSLLVCLPDSLSTPGPVASGTLLRPAAVDGYARRAGFVGATPLELSQTGCGGSTGCGDPSRRPVHLALLQPVCPVNIR